MKLAIGIWTQLRNGFTLIEILIVMLIISIVSSIAVLTITHNQNKNLDYLAMQLTRLISLAEEEAMLRPATLGLAFTPTTFQLYEYQKNKKKWQPLTASPFQARQYNAHLILQIHQENVSLNGQPQLIISESGDITPFVILIGKKDASPLYKIIGQANGSVERKKNEE